MTMFMISDDSQKSVTLKTWDAATKGTTTTLRVTVEVTDAYDLAYMLESLQKIKLAHDNRARLAAAEARKPPALKGKPAKLVRLDQQRMLALPAPRRDGDA
jgi:hypothetical protein